MCEPEDEIIKTALRTRRKEPEEQLVFQISVSVDAQRGAHFTCLIRGS